MSKSQELTELLKGASNENAASVGRIKKREITARAPAIDEMREIQTIIHEIMPVSKKKVNFKFIRVDPRLVDVHPRIPRSQQMLTRQSVSDIIDSIEESGQRDPCLVRVMDDGRFELIDGSRRFFCIRLLEGNKLFVKAGDIPDEDVDAFFELSDQKLKHSDWEKGLYYLKFIPVPYSTKREAQQFFAEKEKVSSITIFYRMQLAELPSYFVALFDTPNDLGRGDIHLFRKEASKNEAYFRAEVEKLVDRKRLALSRGESIRGKDLIRELKKRLSEEPIKAPTSKKTNVYRNRDNKEVLKYRVSTTGNHVFELISASDDDISKIQKALMEVLSISR